MGNLKEWFTSSVGLVMLLNQLYEAFANSGFIVPRTKAEWLTVLSSFVLLFAAKDPSIVKGSNQ